ncbi:hypothetical protein SH1V18_23100 [Vallitalea longa]|uniref:Uncharacterized protein n=1 Tax=Vallitalea longa TaxID=2936439 RepID=A0A9W5Y9L7_9FIRM|nr:hypothetical protein [Vallitalea longa]GKX29830.1 hypothetical protein SH1V18_23100 [Vallitalea longa]
MKINNNDFDIYYNYNNSYIRTNKQNNNTSNEMIDNVTLLISKQGKSLLKEAREKNIYANQLYESTNINNTNVKLLSEEYRTENYFKRPLSAKAINGSKSKFENNSEDQWNIFNNYLKENGVKAEKVEKIEKCLKKITNALDQLNSMDGYRGYSIESVAYTQASEVALKRLNDTLVPDDLKEGFSNLISEYSHFNTESRRLIMEEMTLDYKVKSFGTDKQYEYKDEMINNKQNFHDNEQAYFFTQFSNYYNDDISESEVRENIEKHLNAYYATKYQSENIKTVNVVGNIMSTLNYSKK